MAFIQFIILNPWTLVILVALVGLYVLWRARRKEFRGLGGVSMLGAYTRDLTAEARADRIDPVIGREGEIDRLIHILARKTKNNPILLGAAGVGKTAIVEGLVRRIIAGDIPDNLKDKRLLALDLGGMISGTKYRGEFEERVKKLLAEIIKEKRKIILFIDEVHMIVQAKGAEGALNVSDILKPALARGDLQTIGATTQDEYERHIRPDDALDRRFQPVLVGEPNPQDALAILRGIKEVYEKHHGVQYDDEALKAAVEWGAKYIKGRYLPDKAIDLIDEAGAKVGIEENHEARHAAGLLHAAGCKHAEKMHEHAGKTPVVGAQDIREIVAEWIGESVDKII
ncbi:ATP-dependent Clp protease ATP-binding subunit [Candidatus Uhrbacteria bacterium]|nr:ATP-dependent Clp protease ATP-binding subunit [Candidatus Uhrbacteria bacterium]